MKKRVFVFAVLLYVISVILLATTTPITPHEAKLFYTGQDFISILIRVGDGFGIGFIGLRLPFILFGFITIFLYYQLSKRYFHKSSYLYLSTAIFMFLPGIVTATTLANVSIVVLPLVLIFVLLYEKKNIWILIPIMAMLFYLHEASIIFFIAVLFHAYSKKDKKMIMVSLGFLAIFIYLAKGIAIGGRPSGHFAEIFGLYASLFSPLIFLYFFFTMYRILLRGKKSLIWYISFTALAFSFILSIRQRILITDFAPYVMIAIPLMLQLFNDTIDVRLPQFQKWYKKGFWVVISLSILSTSIIVLHRPLYSFVVNKKNHFAYRIYKPYYIAKDLYAKETRCIKRSKGKELLQLKYYGIKICK